MSGAQTVLGKAVSASQREVHKRREIATFRLLSRGHTRCLRSHRRHHWACRQACRWDDPIAVLLDSIDSISPSEWNRRMCTTTSAPGTSGFLPRPSSHSPLCIHSFGYLQARPSRFNEGWIFRVGRTWGTLLVLDFPPPILRGLHTYTTGSHTHHMTRAETQETILV